MLVGNKWDLHHLCAVCLDDAKAFAKQVHTFFMETSVLEALNVKNTFVEVLTQIYRVVSRKALNIGDDPAALPKGQMIKIETGTMSRRQESGCCSS
ncbi:hypothetical protein NL676_008228 [Syzygium grande]|nr:hypothetical protein NL676_008228 [Syzygium grande]